MIGRIHLLGALAAVLLCSTVAVTARGAKYDPLKVDSGFHAATVDFTVQDAARERGIPIRIYLPAEKSPEPVVLFSPGLGGTRLGNAYMGEHWAARGYVAVVLQHPGSDDSVWRGKGAAGFMPAMKQAANLQNFLLRVEDVPAVLNQLEKWNADKTNVLAGRLDMKKIGMSGHSFGAVTTEAVSGETMITGDQHFTDPRIRAAIVFSPSTPRSLDADEAFASVKIPWLLMTGTKDVTPITATDMASRLGVYPALRLAPKYQVVLFNAEHSAFTERPLPGDSEPRNPNHHRVILAVSTAFLDAYLRSDAKALQWLNGDGPRSIMEKEDKWESANH